MAGGVGSRFWPLSKQSYPKQFLDIYANNTYPADFIYEIKHALQKIFLL